MLKRRILPFLMLAVLCAVTTSAQAAQYLGRCAFVNHAINKFTRSYDTNGHIITTRTGIGSREVYNIADAGNGQVTIQEVWNSKFLQVNPNPYSVVATATSTASNQTKFIQTDLGGGAFAFKSVYNGQYVRVANDGASNAWYANGGTTVDSTYEKFQIWPCPVDMWFALSAFATNYPGKAKLPASTNPPAPGADLRLTADIMDGTTVLYYQIFHDYRFNPIGHPCYDRNGLTYVGQWEVWSCFGTMAQYIDGYKWTEGIPRTRRYLDPTITEDSPVQNVAWYNIPLNCNNTFLANSADWGRRYPAFMQDLSVGRGNSQINMGNRWVLKITYKDTLEAFIYDLGPAPGVFAPLYGAVGYTDQSGVTQWFNNVQPLTDYVAKRCANF